MKLALIPAATLLSTLVAEASTLELSYLFGAVLVSASALLLCLIAGDIAADLLETLRPAATEEPRASLLPAARASVIPVAA